MPRLYLFVFFTALFSHLPTLVQAQDVRQAKVLATAVQSAPVAPDSRPADETAPNVIRLTGRVVDASGRPLPGAIATLVNTAPAPGATNLTVSDGTGRFTFLLPADGSEPLPDGIELQCSYLGFTGQTLIVTPGADNTLFILQELRPARRRAD